VSRSLRGGLEQAPIRWDDIPSSQTAPRWLRRRVVLVRQDGDQAWFRVDALEYFKNTAIHIITSLSAEGFVTKDTAIVTVTLSVGSNPSPLTEDSCPSEKMRLSLF